MTIRAMIVDDEPLARQRLSALLAEISDVEVTAVCADGREAIRAIASSPPDLLFLDVQMPEVDGFQVLQSIGVGRVPIVIFVTAYDQFALRAFEAHALDYLLKPFDDDRFDAAMQRARDRLREREGGGDLEPRLRALLDEMSAGKGTYVKRLGVRSGSRTVFLRTDDIDWIEADGNYVRLHVAGRTYLHRESLTRMAAALDPERFCRIQRGALVNVDRIHAIESVFKGDHIVVLRDGTKLDAGRSYRTNLLRLIDKEP